MAVQENYARHSVLIVAALGVCWSGHGQFRPPYHPADDLPAAQMSTAGQPSPSPHPASTSPSTSTSQATPPAPAAPPSLLTQPAQPAKVILNGGKLTIRAHNSALSEILNKISHQGGMDLRGLHTGKADQRIFGTYGPGRPREVLNELLNGSGYNVLMLGTLPSGLPRQLALSLRPAGGIPNPPPQSEASMREEYEENQIQPTRYPPEPTAHPQAPMAPPAARPGVRTPQEILQELEQMRQRQQQQQSQQPN
jgi:hypothetical protein